jgi:hypothetical protein
MTTLDDQIAAQEALAATLDEIDKKDAEEVVDTAGEVEVPDEKDAEAEVETPEAETDDDEIKSEEIVDEEPEVPEATDASSADTEEKTDKKRGAKKRVTADAEEEEEEEVDLDTVEKSLADLAVEASALLAAELLSQMDVPEDVAQKDAEFLCGVSRKSLEQPCEFCKGGCAPEGDLPGLSDIEKSVIGSMPEGSEILNSGYSAQEDVYVVDVKVSDEDYREAFRSGDGKDLGWLAIDAEYVEKSGESTDVISTEDAVDVASTAFEGEVKGVGVGFFYELDAYVVEIAGEEKSYDVFVSVAGKVLGYDEFTYDSDPELSEDEVAEIKAMEDALLQKITIAEAEIQLKRTYSREMREQLAKTGEAMADGSFPIVDEQDLKNAIQAHERAADPEAAKAHISDRAKALELTALLPTEWGAAEGEQPVEGEEAVAVEGEQPVEATVPEKSDEAPEDSLQADLDLMRELSDRFADDAN